MRTRALTVLALAGAVALLPGGCVVKDDDDSVEAAAPQETAASGQGLAVVAEPLGRGEEVPMSAAELERGRLDPSWRRFAEADTAGTPVPSARADSVDGQRPSGGPGGRTAASETWQQISARSLAQRIATPVAGDVAGPSVLGVQVLLDRARFSPGLIDGRWGKNTEAAVYWLQRREDLPASGEVDERTLQRLKQLAGSPDQLVAEHTLSAEDVKGPFVQLPSDVYERAQEECLCYESLAEKLGERFHSSTDLLRQLNPGVELNSLQAGDRIIAPAVGEAGSGTRVASIIVSGGGNYLHALGPDGRLLFHFPATLGSEYASSPTGDFKVTGIAWDPTWHYQPALLTGEPDDQPDAILPPGPNNAVGVVWMQLSKPHYGIHGTKAPETIGYVTSHGCVRLTNWDARFLGENIQQGVPVQFRDVQQRQGA